jgi:hypothetical protein
MQERVGRRIPSDYASALGRDPVLAPPTCCCCCCCCCTLVVPEATFGKSWANQVMKDYATARAYPPFSEVMKAYAGGIVAGNLMFWIPALIVGFPLVLFTVGIYLAVGPLALLITLAIQGGSIGADLARRRGEGVSNGGLLGTFIGLGMAVLMLGTIVGIGMIGVAIFGGFGADEFLQPEFVVAETLGIACLAGAIAMLVLGLNARRDARRASPIPPTPVYLRRSP